MRTTWKRILQAALLLTLIAYMTQVLRRNYIVNEETQTRLERGPLQLGPQTHFIDENVIVDTALTAKIHNNSADQDVEDDNSLLVRKTRLNDIFISVKTTKNFHKSRLDVILKTWFSAAREQVSWTNIFFKNINSPLVDRIFLFVICLFVLPFPIFNSTSDDKCYQWAS